MGILDTALNTLESVFFGDGANSWWERLENDLVLTSPDGSEFQPLYNGQDVFKITKRLGQFNYPLVKGTVLQDLDTSSLSISLPFVFAGQNHDVEARAFLASCKERGKWQCKHPLHGEYELQLVSAQLTNTITGASEIATEWSEPIDPEKLKTARELKGIVDKQINTLNGGALAQFVADVQDGTETLKHVIKTTSEGIENVVDWALYPLFGTLDAVDQAMTAIHVGIQDSINAVLIPIASLGGQLQELIQLPALSSNNLSNRLDAYTSMISGLTELLPGEAKTPLQRTSKKEAEINNIVVAELGFSSVISSLCRIATTSEIETREDALDTINTLVELYNEIVSTLEEKQSAYYSEAIDNQYFSQSSTYNDASKLVSQTIQYLLVKSFDLKVKRLVKLTRPTPPMRICIDYYNDKEKLGFFIKTNNLSRPEMQLLPAGKEVVIYL